MGAVNIAWASPGAVASKFMKSNAFVRGIRGPVGSGKSVLCAIELMRRAMAQKPGPDNIRRSRWAVIRNTQPELKTTTIKTWLDWFPEDKFGQFNWAPPFTHRIRRAPTSKAPGLDAEFIFLALDRPEDVKKLLSLELTGAWVNEAREVEKAIIDMLTTRVDRYPRKLDGGATWTGIIMDTNAMEPDHWWPIMSGEAPVPEDMPEEDALLLVKPEGWEFFCQPAAMLEKIEDGKLVGYEENPEAENIKNHTSGFEYYRRQIQGKTRAHIRVYVCNKLGGVLDGELVYPQFREDRHVARERLRPIPNVPLIVGMDFGLTPAAVILQNPRGRWVVLRELVSLNMGAVRFADQLKAILESPPFAGFDVMIYGDPAGDDRVQTDETTPFMMVRAAGLPIVAAPSNDPVLRIEAVGKALDTRLGDEEGFLLNPTCTVLRGGFMRGYHYPKIVTNNGTTKYGNAPVKNRFSHVHDALQYGIIGAGGGRALIRSAKQFKPVQAPTTPERPSSVFDRLRANAGAMRRW